MTQASCAKCGAALPEGKRFCPVCGTPVASAFASAEARPVSLAAKLALAAIVVVGVVFAVVVNRGLPPPDDPITLTGSVQRDPNHADRFTVRNGDAFAWTDVALKIHDAQSDYTDRVARIEPGADVDVAARDFVRADGIHYQIQAGKPVNFVLSAHTPKGPGLYEALGL
jgi:hypothetical protein